MLDERDESATTETAPAEAPAEATETASDTPPAKKAAKRAPAKKTAAKRTTKKAAAQAPVIDPEAPGLLGEAEAVAGAESGAGAESEDPAPVAKKAAKRAPAKKAAKRTTKKAAGEMPLPDPEAPEAPAEEAGPATTGAAVLFQAPEPTRPARRTRAKAAPAPVEEAADETVETAQTEDEVAAPTRKSTRTRRSAKKAAPVIAPEDEDEDEEAGDEAGDEAGETPVETDDVGVDEDQEDGEGTPARRRRRRGGRRRRKSGEGGDTDESDSAEEESEDADDAEAGTADGSGEGAGTSRRRRRRRRTGDDNGDQGSDDPENTTTRVRSRRAAEDQITALAGSTRLEAKKQRRREGREAGRRRAPIVSEAEFLARRESVDRTMVIRQRDDLTQIAVLEDKVLVEHYVARESQTSLIGNVYLGRVQNVLPSMEAAFVDIGKGRNAVLYAGEVNWSALGHKDGQPRKIESVLSSGQSVLVQVTKDPVGHKGARLTSQVSLAGRFLVYVPDGTTSGISRKLPDTERNRLKTLLKEIVPDEAGVIVRTAAEGASEEELTQDVERLKARWEDIATKAKGKAPQLLYGEPDLTLKVVRDLFTEDFARLVIQGSDAWDTVQDYVAHVAPDLQDRLERFEPGADNNGSTNGRDVFATYRIEEQINKGLDRKVWLPSGGSLVIDRTEAMTVVDVNTGKFTGSGGNLEETVTKNNLEAAEEIVRQLRLRDIGGIIVVDFIDMVLESNRDLVVRRLVECLGRDRTRHQVAEVTSLGLVQMTRKRIGTGLLEAFATDCEHCHGRGVIVHAEPIEPKGADDDGRRGGNSGTGGTGSTGGRRGRGGRSRGENGGPVVTPEPKLPSPKDIAAMARAERASSADEGPLEQPESEPVETGSEVPPDTQQDSRQDSRQDTQPDTQPDVVAEPAQVTPSEPAPPKVVTRTRRRSASRPAGPGAPVESAESAAPDVVPMPEPAVEAPAAAAPDQGEPAQPAAASEPAPPRVVTRTLRGRARRSAGTPDRSDVDTAVPSVGDVPPMGGVGSPADSGLVEPGTAHLESGEGSEASQVEHVPVKKKGTRKR
ncbi:Rne/Rng family ribonuclease [Nocardioides sp. LHG3406-4]|uniref:Rne/Rng family ribonuclease n=1 Tax=Nocardioides sp. LHG3406-4 TaxID=2804575 RepID=UPI003CE6F935